MSVPNTTTFSLQDVVDEISPSNKNLLSCVSEATFGSYDGNYFSSPATSLLEFRNYGGSQVYTLFYRNAASSGSSLACNTAVTIQVWHNGSGALPVDGDRVYASSNGSTLVESGTYGWNIASGNTPTASAFVNTNGFVSSSDSCLF